MPAIPLYRTLEQELNALLRGASLECLACGEFVLRSGRTVSCPECGSHLREARDAARTGLQFDVQAG
jgi:Zn finger protein HypA/HybF involved in hydrogenase expression